MSEMRHRVEVGDRVRYMDEDDPNRTGLGTVVEALEDVRVIAMDNGDTQMALWWECTTAPGA